MSFFLGLRRSIGPFTRFYRRLPPPKTGSRKKLIFCVYDGAIWGRSQNILIWTACFGGAPGSRRLCVLEDGVIWGRSRNTCTARVGLLAWARSAFGCAKGFPRRLFRDIAVYVEQYNAALRATAVPYHTVRPRCDTNKSSHNGTPRRLGG